MPEIKITEEQVKNGLANFASLMRNVEKVEDYSESTLKDGTVKTKNPKDEGALLAHSGQVVLIDADDRSTPSPCLPVEETTRSWYRRNRERPLVQEDPGQRREAGGHLYDEKTLFSQPSKLEFALEAYLRHNAMAMIENDGDNSIAMKLMKLLLIHPTLMLIGWVGCGKTHNLNLAYQKLCDKYGNWVKLDFTGCDGAKDDDLLGCDRQVNGNLAYVYGFLSEAFRRASEGEKVFLYVDEINRFSTKAQNIFIQALNLIREPGFTGFRLINYHTQEKWLAPTIFDPTDPSKGCIRIVSSVNIGDQGTNQLSGALKRRFSCMFPIYYLPAEQEAQLLFDHCEGKLPNKVCKGMVTVANNVRESFKKWRGRVPSGYRVPARLGIHGVQADRSHSGDRHGVLRVHLALQGGDVRSQRCSCGGFGTVLERHRSVSLREVDLKKTLQTSWKRVRLKFRNSRHLYFFPLKEEQTMETKNKYLAWLWAGIGMILVACLRER
jgi:MoxR-like ATPase